MNPDIKQRWLAALRSGQYKQGYNFLAQTDNPSSETKYCCLGVLCELAVQDGIVDRSVDKYGTASYSKNNDKSMVALPHVVKDWAELAEPNPQVLVLGVAKGLAGLNDRGESFFTIADLIDEQL